MTARDTSQVIPYEPVVIVGRADRDPNRAWSRALTVPDELGPKPVIQHPQPRAIDVLVDLRCAVHGGGALVRGGRHLRAGAAMRHALDTLSLALFVLLVWALVIIVVPLLTVWRWMR